MTPIQQIHAIVHGRVQGVGFRMHTLQIAQEIGCVGWVRNLPNGTVACMVQGDERQIQHLLGFLHVGPPAAQVQSVEVTEVDTLDAFEEFTIIR